MAGDSPLPKQCNAWIFLNEDAPRTPSGNYLLYPDGGSVYQRLIAEGVYKHVDMLMVCFAEIVPTNASTIPSGTGANCTLRMGGGDHADAPGKPVRFTNQDYFEYVVRDARKENPNIRILMTLVWGSGNGLNIIFQNGNNTEEENAALFSQNLVTYLRHYKLDGFDIDWERPLSTDTPKTRMSLILRALHQEFSRQTDRKFWLVLCPVTSRNLDAAAVNETADFLSLQLYGGTTAEEYTRMGIKKEKLAHGAKFESEYQTAEKAYAEYKMGGYAVSTQWRLNSGNFVFEQDEHKKFYRLVHGSENVA